MKKLLLLTTAMLLLGGWTNGYGPINSKFNTWDDFALGCDNIRTGERTDYVVHPAESRVYWANKSAPIGYLTVEPAMGIDKSGRYVALEKVQELRWDHYSFVDTQGQMFLTDGQDTSACAHISMDKLEPKKDLGDPDHTQWPNLRQIQ